MNRQIEEIENAIIEAKTKLKTLNNSLLTAYTYFLESRGVVSGSIITIGNEKGIFKGVRFDFGRIVPIVMKVKKDGTAHSSAHVYFWSWKDIKELQTKGSV